MLSCTNSNLEEEKQYSTSCDFLIESLHDLELALRKSTQSSVKSTKAPDISTTDIAFHKRRKRFDLGDIVGGVIDTNNPVGRIVGDLVRGNLTTSTIVDTVVGEASKTGVEFARQILGGGGSGSGRETVISNNNVNVGIVDDNPHDTNPPTVTAGTGAVIEEVIDDAGPPFYPGKPQTPEEQQARVQVCYSFR